MSGIFYRSVINTRRRILHLLHDTEVKRRKTIKHAFSVLCSDKIWFFDQSEPARATNYVSKE